MSIAACVLRLTYRSFLEDGKNTDLIRWSDDGNSFIVLNEEDFAKTLIPELFKHSNYASFVRQLNMYGFHKKVGLSDNSMRASEKKSKSPSEYANPYFRRGHRDLLWLIQKPKTAETKKPAKDRARAEDDQFDEDDGAQDYDLAGMASGVRPQLALEQNPSTLTPQQSSTIQRELQSIKHSQTQIAKMMTALKREHEALYSQAMEFQDQHIRHENSINAILTFLATVYNRSLQGQETGVPGIANLFQNSVPGVDTSTGNIFDAGDLNLDGASIARQFKKQPLLLKAAPDPSTSGMSPVSSAGGNYQGRQTRRMSQILQGNSPNTGNIHEVFDSTANTPTPVSPGPQSQPQRDMMSVIQNTNARHSSNPATPAEDFTNVLSSLEHSGGHSPLTSSQRADMLRLMNDSSSPRFTSNSTRDGGNNSNALMNTHTSSIPPDYDRKLLDAQNSLDSLARLQADQEQSVQNLTSLLQPLSPTGSIPGIHDDTDIAPPPLDIDAFLSNTDYFTDFPGSDPSFDPNISGGSGGGGFQTYNGDGTEDDDELFGDLPPTNPTNDDSDMNKHTNDPSQQGGRVESVATTNSSGATTPQTATYDHGSVNGNDWNTGTTNTAVGNGPTTRAKGRRMSNSATMDTGRAKRRRGNG